MKLFVKFPVILRLGAKDPRLSNLQARKRNQSATILEVYRRTAVDSEKAPMLRPVLKPKETALIQKIHFMSAVTLWKRIVRG